MNNPTRTCHRNPEYKNAYTNKKYGKCKDKEKYNYLHKEYKGTNTKDNIADSKYYAMNGWFQ